MLVNAKERNTQPRLKESPVEADFTENNINKSSV